MPPKRNSDPNKPKGRTSAYAFFVADSRERSKKAGKSVGFADFSKECSDKWKRMSDGEKKEFHDLAEQDKKRYMKEMENYVPSAGSKRRVRVRRRKDPNAPKRGLSAFMCFCQEQRPAVKEKNPDYSIGDIAKELGRQWKALSDRQKVPYEEMSKKDRQRYEEEMESYVPQDADDDEEEEEEEEEDDD